MGVPTSKVGYTLATTGRGVHEVHKGHVVVLGEKTLQTTRKNYVPREMSLSFYLPFRSEAVTVTKHHDVFSYDK
jgi:hypothetical protein